MEIKILLILSAVNIIYALIGGAIMMALESTYEDDSSNEVSSTITKFMNDHSSCMTKDELHKFIQHVRRAHEKGIIRTNQTSSMKQWDYINSVFFVLTATTTIGYGNQTPATKGGRAFIVLYAILGIPITGLLLTGLAFKLKKILNFLQNKKIVCLQKYQKLTLQLERFPVIEIAIRIVILHGALVIVLLLIPSAIFCAIEGWAYSDALYYSFITLTTIGFGDFVVGSEQSAPVKAVYKIIAIIWIFIGLAWIGSEISIATDRYNKYMEERENMNTTNDNQNTNKI